MLNLEMDTSILLLPCLSMSEIVGVVCGSEFNTRLCIIQGTNGNVNPAVLHKILVTL